MAASRARNLGCWECHNGSFGIRATLSGPKARQRYALACERVGRALQGVAGNCGCVVAGEDFAVATPGRFRSWPLFYRYDPHGGVVLADHLRRLTAYAERSATDGVAEVEFLNAGFCTGRRTLGDGVYQLLPAEALILRAGAAGAEAKRLYVYPNSKSAPWMPKRLSRSCMPRITKSLRMLSALPEVALSFCLSRVAMIRGC